MISSRLHTKNRFPQPMSDICETDRLYIRMRETSLVHQTRVIAQGRAFWKKSQALLKISSVGGET